MHEQYDEEAFCRNVPDDSGYWYKLHIKADKNNDGSLDFKEFMKVMIGK